MARKSLMATLVGVAALVVPSALADQGGIPHDGSNGQGRPADQTQAQARGKAMAKGHAKVHAKAQAKGQATVHASGKALAKGHAKTHGSSQATTHGKALAKGQAKSQATAQVKANTHANAGKTTFCHATGSQTNPFVTITTSNNALPAHRRHQDGRDIIPAPGGGCPQGGAQGNTPGIPPTEQKLGKTTICHATGSSTNPFVIITISDNALAAHTAHQGGRDIIPAPANGICAQGANVGQPVTPGVTPAAGTTPAAGQVMGETTAGSKTPNNVSVLGASTGSAPSASSSPAATGTQPSSSSGLPFTGTDAIIVAILGLAALLLGVTVRRATTNRV